MAIITIYFLRQHLLIFIFSLWEQVKYTQLNFSLNDQKHKKGLFRTKGHFCMRNKKIIFIKKGPIYRLRVRGNIEGKNKNC